MKRKTRIERVYNEDTGWFETAAADTVHDAAARRPADRPGIPGAAAHIGEGTFRRGGGLALEPIEDHDDHGAGEPCARFKGRVGRAGKELVRHGEVNGVVRPVARGRHIGESAARTGFAAGARSGHRVSCPADGADPVDIAVRGGDGLLRRQHLAAEGAPAALGQARRGAGGRHGRERLRRVGSGRDGLGHRLAGIAGVNARAGGCAGRLPRDDAGVPRVGIGGAHLRDARGEPGVHVRHGIGIRRAGRPGTITGADKRPQPVIHGGAGRQVCAAGHDPAAVPHKPLRLREERIVTVIADGRAEAGDLQERGHEVAPAVKVIVRADIAAGQLHIRNRACVQQTAGILIKG